MKKNLIEFMLSLMFLDGISDEILRIVSMFLRLAQKFKVYFIFKDIHVDLSTSVFMPPSRFNSFVKSTYVVI